MYFAGKLVYFIVRASNQLAVNALWRSAWSCNSGIPKPQRLFHVTLTRQRTTCIFQWSLEREFMYFAGKLVYLIVRPSNHLAVIHCIYSNSQNKKFKDCQSKFQGRSPKFKEFSRTNSFSRKTQNSRSFQGLWEPWKSANLVEDIMYLFLVKLHQISFSGSRRLVENISANQRPGRQSWFSDRPEKHKLGRECWVLASCQVSANSVQEFQRKCQS